MQENSNLGDMNYGVIRIICATGTVLLNGEPVHLSRMEYWLLYYLIQHSGEILTRQDILASVWGAPSSLKTRTLDIHVCSLRKKLDLIGKLETIIGVGYRLRCERKDT